MAAQARPHALIVVAHSPGSKASDEAWTPPYVFLRGVAQQFEAELICCSDLNEHSEKSISKSCGAKVATASTLHKVAREGEAVPLVVLVADEAGLGSLDQADRLALRKIISDCRTCVVDAKAANGSLFWFEGLFDGATIPRELGREIYGGLDFWLGESCVPRRRVNANIADQAVRLVTPTRLGPFETACQCLLRPRTVSSSLHGL